MTEARFLALRDRAFAYLCAHGASVSEDALLREVYGGAAPAALRPQLVAPLLDDPRFERSPDDNSWRLARTDQVDDDAYTALALAATGPSPARGRIVCIVALHVGSGAVAERFMAVVHPGKRVPRYVAERLGLDPAVLDDLRPFASVVDALIRFFGRRPIVAQDAALTWAFVDAEARRCERVLAEPTLADVNDLATRLLQLGGKPTLARVAARLGVSVVRMTEPEEEARVLVEVTNRLLALSSPSDTTARGATAPDIAPSDRARGLTAVLSAATIDGNSASAPRRPPAALRRPSTARALPDRPGVYTMRDADQNPLYVGKARRLSARVAAYVNRPLGATRRLEGLVSSVDRVDPQECATDLEALVLEDREIRRLAPRFNTVRQQRAPRLWIRLPPTPSGRRAAPRRLELVVEPGALAGEFVGPFRNQLAAERARALVRDVFQLDALRRTDLFAYAAHLLDAWDFLNSRGTAGHADRLASGGAAGRAERLARQQSTRLLRAVLDFDLAALLLPADPRHARFAVVRPSPNGVEGFVLDQGVCVGWRELEDVIDTGPFAIALLGARETRTAPEDADVVIRWLGAQRPSARLILLPDDPLAAADAVEAAVLALWEARATDGEDALDPVGDAVPSSGEVGG